VKNLLELQALDSEASVNFPNALLQCGNFSNF